ncbi:DUF1015 domain-containing protein [Flavobacterium selenitireducens]|uniref:DUF1015 domain-containing protein n=1 Tax=Flavobacterium selenitireducens TaxID=2722704 RepID=UPI00168ACA45|nr:DUF1015 domain-containing protein [Flavobacterium selenitireducens]MBD3582966.1 DUF1015 domain-containing protein [Flavobacterium selenitireducens]
MPKITPFPAVRPTRDKAPLVTSRSYDDYTASELAAQLDFNPFSFLHVLHPGYVNVQKNDPNKRFGQVKAKYQDFKDEGVLKKETEPIFYLYELQSKSRSYTGIIASISVQDYLDGKLKKHEDTLEYRVEQFEEYLHITGFNTEPVLVAYPENPSLQNWIDTTRRKRPLYLFSSPNRDKHTLWRIRDKQQIDWLVTEFEKIPSLYIADGHHRSASAAMLYERHNASGNSNLGHFMAFLVSENEVKINEYNRVISDLNDLSKAEFLSRVEKVFTVVNRGNELWKPIRKGQFGMYFDGDFYALEPLSETSDIDAQLLYDELLNPILGIGDLRNDGRIDYIPGNQPLTKMVELVDTEAFEVGFTLFPIAFSQIRELADKGEILPPKSTYIEPKIRSGLVIYEI